MADGKRIAKTVLRGLGKGLKLCGKGLWIFGKAVARDIDRAYQNHQEQERIRAIRRRELAQIEEESYHEGLGYGRGMNASRQEERDRRQAERDRIAYQKRLDSLFPVPKLNDRVFTEDFEPTKRKKKRSGWDW